MYTNTNKYIYTYVCTCNCWRVRVLVLMYVVFDEKNGQACVPAFAILIQTMWPSDTNDVAFHTTNAPQPAHECPSIHTQAPVKGVATR